MTNPLIPTHVQTLMRSPLQSEEELRLIKIAQLGDRRAAAILIEANIGFVAKLTKNLKLRSQLPFSVLLGDGMSGLYHSIFSFDERKGVTKLISWGYWWIRHFIVAAIHEDSNMPLPTNFYDARRSIDKEMDRQFTEKNRLPNLNWVMDDLGISDIDRMRFVNYGNDQESINATIDHSDDEGDGYTLEDILPDYNVVPADQIVTCREIRERIHRILRKDARMEEILFAAEGLDGRAEETNLEISKRLGMSEERVRQLRIKAMELIRRDSVLSSIAASN